MEKNKADRRLLFMIMMFVVGGIFTLLYFMLFGNTAQRYDDFVIGMAAYFGENKNMEISLIRLLVFVGCAAYFLFYIKTEEKGGREETAVLSKQGDESLFMLTVVLTAVTTIFVFGAEHGYFNDISAAILVCVAVSVFADRENAAWPLTLMFLVMYAVTALYQLWFWLGGSGVISPKMVALCMIAGVLVFMPFKNRVKAIRRACLVVQLFIPLLLLVHLADRYVGGDGKTIVVPVPKRIILINVVFMLAFTAENIVRLAKNINKDSGLEKVISFGTCAVIMTFNRFNGAGAVFLGSDVRHPWENIIDWFRYFERGEVPFETSISVSGFFSVVQGVFFKFLGGGKIAYYNISENMFYMFIIIAVVYLVRKHLNGFYAFAAALVLTVTEYNRYAFVLPICLLLMLPLLVKRRDLWLKVWFLSSLFYGIYYPSFGAAVCIAFMPLGIWQAVSFVKTGEFKNRAKKPMFWILWALCLAPAVFFAKLLVKMLIHIKIMGSQTIAADGSTRFAQMPEETWMPFLSDNVFIRTALYDVLTFLVPAAVVWVIFALSLKAGKLSYDGKKAKMGDPAAFCTVFSGVLLLAVSFVFTFVRLNFYNMFSRSDGVLAAAGVMLVIAAHRYLGNTRMKYAVCAAAVAVPCLASHIFYDSYFTEIGFANTLTRHSSVFYIPEGFVYVENDENALLNGSFIEKGIYDEIKEYAKATEKYDRNASYTMIYPSYLYYYLNDVKTAGVMESSTASGFDTAKEAAYTAEKNGSYFGAAFDPVQSYYISNWLHTSGKYVWSDEMHVFVPNTKGLSKEEVMEANKASDAAAEMTALPLMTAQSLGDSMDSLKKIFTPADAVFTTAASADGGAEIRFGAPVLGDDADFMYIEIGGRSDLSYGIGKFEKTTEFQFYDSPRLSKYLMKKYYNKGKTVLIGWDGADGEPHYLRSILGDGRLLLPLGANTDWLLNRHDSFTIYVFEDGTNIIQPFEIKKLEMLKLREI